MKYGEICMSIRQSWVEGQTQLVGTEHLPAFLPYPIDMSAFLTLPHCSFDTAGVPYDENEAAYHPTTIAQYALAHWNQYLATNDEKHREAFLAQETWLFEHTTPIGEGAAGWPISSPHPDFQTRGPWLSALAQGSGLSVLVRAYQLTRDGAFLEVAHRVVRTFERDILDGGVSTPIGVNGIFFEEIAVYPAAHILSGFIFALFGLYDYAALTEDIKIKELIACSLETMHSLLKEFDIGFWTYSDLLHRRLASPSELALQTTLLEAIARYSGCAHCSKLTSLWMSYQRRWSFRLHYLIASRWTTCRRALGSRLQAALFPKSQASPALRVCVPLPSFPVTGGILTVLEGVAQVTKDLWQLEYLTQYVGPQSERYVIHRFSTAKVGPWHFPLVWAYELAGWGKLLELMRHRAGYHIILPQDGVFTAAFAALVAKLANVRTVCIDHGDLRMLDSRHHPLLRSEYMADLATRDWPWGLLLRGLSLLYWPSLHLLAAIAAHFIDHYLIPGVAGDGAEEVCQGLGIQQSRITRYGSMIDIDRHILLESAARARMREEKGIAADAIIVAIICRLSPEKGLDIALESVNQTLSALSLELQARVRVIIAGDGPLRKQVEDDIFKRGLGLTCMLWGDISSNDVISLLAISDIFLYTSRRGSCYAMAVLEAMASGCAVIASTEPISNELLLAEGRGIAVPPDDAEQTTQGLVQLVNNLELCRQMGRLAREYIAAHHSPTAFRRTLLQATYWSELENLLKSETKLEGIADQREGNS
jgi:glycosyltransferase involved in cell wall biosynthesis